MTPLAGRSVLAEALVRWQHAAGPFWPYVCAAPFLGTEDGESLARHIQSASARRGQGAAFRASRLAALADRLRAVAGPAASDLPPHPSAAPSPGYRSPAILLVDLPAEPVLAAAPLLVERGWYVVPVVQRWIASPAVLPCRRLIERLVIGAWQAHRPTTPLGAILIADGERTGPMRYPPVVAGRAFDNRYEYQICRFPSTDFLNAHGVRRVHWITTSASPAERPVRPDLAPYLEALLQAGLTVNVHAWPGHDP